MKIRAKKAISFIMTLTLVLQSISAMTLHTYAAAYDGAVQYTPSTAWGGRASNAAMAAIGGRMYAYIGRMTDNVGAGGLTVLDITNPQEPVEVQSVSSTYIDMGDHLPTNEKLCVKDGFLIVQDKTDSAVEVYRINEEDGTIDEALPLAQLSDGFSWGQASLKVCGEYLFVVGRNATRSMRVYDIANPAQIKEITPQSTPVSPAMETETEEAIATFTADYADMGNGIYRMYATNRVKVQGADVFLLSIRDITIADGRYTVNTLYEGRPAGTAFDGDNSGNIYDVDVVNQDCIVVTDGSNQNTVDDLELIDVSDPSAPEHMAYSGQNGRGTSVCVDENHIISGTQDGVIRVYTVQENAEHTYALELVKQISTPGSQVYETGVYAGFIYAANNAAFVTYEYKYGVSIDAGTVDKIGAEITGTVDGYLPGDTVTVTVDGNEYTATVQGNRFSAAVSEAFSEETVSVTVQLIRGAEILGTDTETLRVVSSAQVVYNDITELQFLNSIEHLSGGRATDAAGLTLNGKKLMYVYTTSGMVVYDVTDMQNVQEVQRVPSMGGKVFNSQMQIKDGYLIVLNAQQGNKVEFYKIGPDGKIPDTAAWTVGLGNSDKESTIELVDNYLFEAMHGTTGKQLNVYDVSDISAGVPKLGNTELGVGVHALEIQKVSDILYRLYYVSRSEADGWKFCINDMTVSEEGSLQFNAAYPAGLNFQSPLSSIGDIAYIGNNNVFLAFTDNTQRKSYIVNVQDPAAPTAAEVNGRSLSAIELGNDYYAVGTQDGTVKFYNQQDNREIRTLTFSGQIYNISMYDGKLLIVSDSAVHIYDGLYTGITIDSGDLALAAQVTITGAVEGYMPGDSVQMTAGNAAGQAEITESGIFTYTFAPQGAGPVSVTAALYRDGGRLLAAEKTVQIVDPYAGLPECIYDTNMTIRTTVTNEKWDSSNRQTSLAFSEINGRDYVYSGSYNNLVVYDITDPAGPVFVQENDIHVVLSGNAYNKTLAVKDGYIFTGAIPEGQNWQNVDVYALGADGKLADAPVASLSTGNISELAIIDDYLFVSCNSSSGIVVYDISDVGNIQKIGTLGGVEQTRAFHIEKTAPGAFRTYIVERIKVDGVDDWHLAIYDIAIEDGAAVFTNRYKGAHDNKNVSVKDIVKIDSDTIAVANEAQNSTLDFYNVSDPENPVLEQQIGIRTQTALGVSGGEYLVIGTPEGSAALLPQGADAVSKTVALNCGNVYQIAEYRGNLVFACLQGLVIASMKTELVVDSTEVSGENPAISGTINGYQSGDVLKAFVNGTETAAAVANGDFTISLAGLFEDGDTADVRLVLERDGNPIIAKACTVYYSGYPYAVTSVDAAQGITVTYEKLRPQYADAVTIYAAVYEDDALIQVDVKRDVTAGGTWITDIAEFDSQTQTVKIFVWDSGLNPAAAVYTPVVAEVAQNF